MQRWNQNINDQGLWRRPTLPHTFPPPLAEGMLPVYRYHVAPLGLAAGSTIMSGEGAPVLPGCVLRLRDIPVGQHLFNLEINPGGGGKVVRAAHTCAVIVVKQQKDAVVRLPSGGGGEMGGKRREGGWVGGGTRHVSRGWLHRCVVAVVKQQKDAYLQVRGGNEREGRDRVEKAGWLRRCALIVKCGEAATGRGGVPASGMEGKWGREAGGPQHESEGCPHECGNRVVKQQKGAVARLPSGKRQRKGARRGQGRREGREGRAGQEGRKGGEGKGVWSGEGWCGLPALVQ